MRAVIAVLVFDGLLVAGATANQFYQGWADREAMKPVPIKPTPICRDSVVVAFPGEKLSDTGWLVCQPDQIMETEYFQTQDPNKPYMIVHCVCFEEILGNM